jgi:chromosomal replication initiator protein
MNDTAVTTRSDATGEGLWEQASAHLRAQLSEGTFSAWFTGVKALHLDHDTVTLAVPNPFTKQWIESRYLDLVHDAFREAANRSLTVALSADDGGPVPIAVEAEPEPLPTPAPPHSGRDRTTGVGPAQDGRAHRGLAPTATEPSTSFHPKYVFDSFVIGSSNRFAHAAALAVAEAPAQAYNPLFIYGGAGLGKTHLLHAIGTYLAHCHPNQVVRYISTEQFTNDFIVALQRRTIPDFHRRYRAVDVLLIDDIQFLEKKEGTQEEFFHTFNALHPSSQVVITSDRPPKKIATLEERLRTRFEWGLITDIQPPDIETRLAILQKKAETDGLHVPAEVMSFIASHIQTNIRELEGALIRVVAYASLTGTEVTPELARDVLKSLLSGTTEARVTADLVISVTAGYFDVTDEEIRSSSRSRPLVNARQTAMYLCRELTDLSLPKIGERFGGRDHSTVIHATNKIRGLLKERQSCYEQVQELTARIRQQAARG